MLTSSPRFAGPITSIAAASDHSFALTRAGKAYSWGFSTNYQTGQGTTDDVEVATLVVGAAIKEKELSGATLGGQFGVLFSS